MLIQKGQDVYTKGQGVNTKRAFSVPQHAKRALLNLRQDFETCSKLNLVFILQIQLPFLLLQPSN